MATATGSVLLYAFNPTPEEFRIQVVLNVLISGLGSVLWSIRKRGPLLTDS